jgi:hypothetical protein
LSSRSALRMGCSSGPVLVVPGLYKFVYKVFFVRKRAQVVCAFFWFRSAFGVGCGLCWSRAWLKFRCLGSIAVLLTAVLP